MDLDRFFRRFDELFPPSYRENPNGQMTPGIRLRSDPCPDVSGKASLRKLQLLDAAVASMGHEEAYLEVGTFVGKSLISATLLNPERRIYACDNFSEFEDNSLDRLMGNLSRYDLADRVTFFDDDFRQVIDPELISDPVGVYFYDGAHDEQSHFDAIHLAERVLADEALVIIDDWRFAPDSRSYAQHGTQRAVDLSDAVWEKRFELPARRNGDLELWWNGVAVYAFRRRGVGAVD